MTIRTMQTYSYEMYKLLKEIQNCLWQDVEAFARVDNAIGLYDLIDELFKEMHENNSL